MLSLERIDLRDWRNFESADVSLDRRLTVIAGPNAMGKTNIVEAIHLLTCGQTFRGSRSVDMVRHDQQVSRITGVIGGDGRRIDVRVDIAEGRRKFSRNGKPCQGSSMPTVLPAVTFTPDDLDMVKGSPSRRRRELDVFGTCVSQTYGQLLTNYSRIVEQRNRLLKEDVIDDALLMAWDEQLVSVGASVISHRMNLARLVAQAARTAHASIADGEELLSTYECSAGELGQTPSVEDIRHRLADALANSRVEERARRQTVVGPHRDDILFEVEGRAAREFCSQGQQRSIVLAWKVAEVEVARGIGGQPPMLLLDDVMSELDESRRDALTRSVIGDAQTVVTTTNLGYFSDELLNEAKVVRVGEEGVVE